MKKLFFICLLMTVIFSFKLPAHAVVINENRTFLLESTGVRVIDPTYGTNIFYTYPEMTIDLYFTPTPGVIRMFPDYNFAQGQTYSAAAKFYRLQNKLYSSSWFDGTNLYFEIDYDWTDSDSSGRYSRKVAFNVNTFTYTTVAAMNGNGVGIYNTRSYQVDTSGNYYYRVLDGYSQGGYTAKFHYSSDIYYPYAPNNWTAYYNPDNRGAPWTEYYYADAYNYLDRTRSLYYNLDDGACLAFKVKESNRTFYLSEYYISNNNGRYAQWLGDYSKYIYYANGSAPQSFYTAINSDYTVAVYVGGVNQLLAGSTVNISTLDGFRYDSWPGSDYYNSFPWIPGSTPTRRLKSISYGLYNPSGTFSMGVSNSNVSITGWMSDLVPGNVSKIYCNVDGANTTAVSGNITGSTSAQNISASYNVSWVSSGTHTLNVWLQDNDGDASNISSYTFSLDSIPPTAPSISANQSWINAANVPINITSGVDYESGVNRTEYSLSGATSSGWTTYTGTVYAVNEGQTTITARTVDNAGNYSTTASAIVKIDRGSPTYASVLSVSGSYSTAGSYKLRVTGVGDSVSGVNRVCFPTWTNYNGQDDLAADWYNNTIGTNMGGGIWEFTVNASQHNNEEGLYITHFYIYDNAGNYTFAGQVTVTVDRVAPTAPIITANTGWTNAAGVPVSVTSGSDATSGVKRTEYSLSGATTLGWTTYTGTFSIYNEGQTTITARTVDNAGNYSANAASVVKIDRTGPVIGSVDAAQVLKSNTSTFRVNAYSVTDLNSIQKVEFWTNFNNQGWIDRGVGIQNGSTYYMDFPANATPGTYQIKMTAYDIVGNASADKYTSVRVNNVPTGSILSPLSGNYQVASKPVFSIRPVDSDGDSMSAKLVYYDGSNWQTVPGSSITGLSSNLTYTISLPDDFWRGLLYDYGYKFRLQVSDNWDSYENPADIIITKINTPPTITVNSPSNYQYMTSGYLEFNCDTYDPDGQTLNLKIYTDTPNILNDGVFFDGPAAGNVSFISYTYMPVGQHNIYLELSDGQAVTRETRIITIPKEISLDTGNSNVSYYIPKFDLAKNTIYYNRLNTKLSDTIRILNVLGANADRNELYVGNATGMQNVTGLTDYKSSGTRIYAKDGVKPNSIFEWIMDKINPSSLYNQILSIGTTLNIKNILFKDEEKDYTSVNPNRGKNRRFQIIHTPQIYENPDAAISNNGAWINEADFTSFDGNPVNYDGQKLDLQFTKAGKYIFNIVEDDSSANKKGKDFSKSSNLSNYAIYVHRPPKAIAKYTELGGTNIKLYSSSYDLDFYSLPDRGIKTTKWEYRVRDYSDNIVLNWTTIPDINNFFVDPAYQTDVRLSVTDYGAIYKDANGAFVDNDGELTSVDILVFDKTGKPPVTDFAVNVGTSDTTMVPSGNIVYMGNDGHETVHLDDSLITWNDFFAVGGTRTETWTVSVQNFTVDRTASSSLSDLIPVEDTANSGIVAPGTLPIGMTTKNKFKLTNSLVQNVSIKKVDLINNTPNSTDAEADFVFDVALTSANNITQWSDFQVKINSADMSINNVALDNDSSNIFRKTVYIPSTPTDNCNYTVSIYSNRTGELLQTNNYILTVNNLKLTNLRITTVAGSGWKKYFTNPGNNVPTGLQLSGIQTKDMPVYRNNEHNGVKLGFGITAKIDSYGLYNAGDTISVGARFFALDNMGNLTEADAYIEDTNGNYRIITSSDYNSSSRTLLLNSSNRYISEVVPADNKYNTWIFDYFLPPNTKFVPKGVPLDLVAHNYFDYKLLVVFDVVAHKNSGQTFDYTTKETNWATSNGNIYGSNRPSNMDLIGKGINHGEIFYYNIYESALDELNIDRKW